ncbi:MAG: GNAT family N-acetyltransferase, partial [Phycisphaeraceae bacterium]|nr:GNAT family N-acetyltransferase [Phycisphaeraceae bacterium]
FIRGAAMSRGGKPIIALPSTAKGGTLSRIATHIDEGGGVVTSRGDVHYVVTEFGVAYLHGKTIRERALALINIAHPDFRQELLDFVKGKHYVFPTDRLPERVRRPDPKVWETWERFGGKDVLVRPIDPTDERALQEFFYSHDRETVYNRYFTTKAKLGREEASHLCTIGYSSRMAFGVFEKKGPAEKFVAIGRYDLNPRTDRAETTLVVERDWRRLGVASYLFTRLAQYAKTKGIHTFHSEILARNEAMVNLHRNLGHDVRRQSDSDSYIVHWRFDDIDLGDPSVRAT